MLEFKIKMSKKESARSFVGIMVAIALLSLLLRVIVNQIININLSQNESSASSTLKLISTALENYAKDNQGNFPAAFSNLIQGQPQYLDINYLEHSPLKGYNYSCVKFEPDGYSCSANVVSCRLSGNKNYAITTGGLLTIEECRKKE